MAKGRVHFLSHRPGRSHLTSGFTIHLICDSPDSSLFSLSA